MASHIYRSIEIEWKVNGPEQKTSAAASGSPRLEPGDDENISHIECKQHLHCPAKLYHCK